MKTLLRLGPADHGRPLTLEEFLHTTGKEGYRYELINGRVQVTPAPNAPEGLTEFWLWTKLFLYSRDYPEVVNLVYNKPRVHIPGRQESTVPEPDIAAYRDFPLRQRRGEISWQDHSPVLVVEVLSADDPNKDLVRNVALYLQVPSIREYWIVDGRQNPDEPSLLVYRRRGRRWQRAIEVEFGDTYATPLLPGFSLVVDPHA